MHGRKCGEQGMRLQKKYVQKFIKKVEVKRYIYQSRKEVNEQFGKINQNVSGNRKFFWKKWLR